MTPRNRIQQLLDAADVRLDGDRPWDIRIHDESFLNRVLAHGSLALGESYMNGSWDCARTRLDAVQGARGSPGPPGANVR